MFILTLFSGVLFVIPVFVTFGVYFGVEHEKILRPCGLSCGQTGNDTIDDPDKLQQTTFCQKSYAIAPPPSDYILYVGGEPLTRAPCSCVGGGSRRQGFSLHAPFPVLQPPKPCPTTC